MASVIVTGSLTITGSTFVGSGVVTDGLDYYFDAGNSQCFNSSIPVSIVYTPIKNIAKGGGNPFVSGGFAINNSSSTALSYDTLYDPSFGGCLFVSRSGVVASAAFTTPSITMTRTSTLQPSLNLNTLFYQRYLAGRNELTLGIWFKRITSNGTMFQMSTTFIRDQPFSVWVSGDQLSFRFWQADNSWGSGITPLGVNGAWNYYTIVFNNGVITGYTNGTSGTPITLLNGVTTISPSNPSLINSLFQIGGSNNSPNRSAMIGYLGPAQIYGRALTQQEILQNYHTMKGRFGIYI